MEKLFKAKIYTWISNYPILYPYFGFSRRITFYFRDMSLLNESKKSIICHIFSFICILAFENFRSLYASMAKIVDYVQEVFICHCTGDFILTYYPRMKFEVVSHFMFGSLFGQKLSKFITLILCITKWDYVVKIWAIHSVVHKIRYFLRNNILSSRWSDHLKIIWIILFDCKQLVRLLKSWL